LLSHRSFTFLAFSTEDTSMYSRKGSSAIKVLFAAGALLLSADMAQAQCRTGPPRGGMNISTLQSQQQNTLLHTGQQLTTLRTSQLQTSILTGLQQQQQTAILIALQQQQATALALQQLQQQNAVLSAALQQQQLLNAQLRAAGPGVK
jgi:hypothetical protein